MSEFKGNRLDNGISLPIRAAFFTLVDSAKEEHEETNLPSFQLNKVLPIGELQSLARLAFPQGSSRRHTRGVSYSSGVAINGNEIHLTEPRRFGVHVGRALDLDLHSNAPIVEPQTDAQRDPGDISIPYVAPRSFEPNVVGTILTRNAEGTFTLHELQQFFLTDDLMRGLLTSDGTLHLLVRHPNRVPASIQDSRNQTEVNRAILHAYRKRGLHHVIPDVLGSIAEVLLERPGNRSREEYVKMLCQSLGADYYVGSISTAENNTTADFRKIA